MRAPLLFSNEHLAHHLELAWLEACQRMISLKDAFGASCMRVCDRALVFVATGGESLRIGGASSNTLEHHCIAIR
jgi:hypothetical protein